MPLARFHGRRHRSRRQPGLADGDVTAEAIRDWSVIADNPPIASSGSVTTTENQAVDGRLEASDPDPGQSLTYTIVSTPAHGEVALDGSTGAFSYTPGRNFSGSDEFTFKANDGYLDSNVATESLSVEAAPPTSPPAHGGGGASAPIWLALLLGCFGFRRRPRKGPAPD